MCSVKTKPPYQGNWKRIGFFAALFSDPESGGGVAGIGGEQAFIRLPRMCCAVRALRCCACARARVDSSNILLYPAFSSHLKPEHKNCKSQSPIIPPIPTTTTACSPTSLYSATRQTLELSIAIIYIHIRSSSETTAPHRPFRQTATLNHSRILNIQEIHKHNKTSTTPANHAPHTNPPQAHPAD